MYCIDIPSPLPSKTYSNTKSACAFAEGKSIIVKSQVSPEINLLWIFLVKIYHTYCVNDTVLWGFPLNRLDFYWFRKIEKPSIHQSTLCTLRVNTSL